MGGEAPAEGAGVGMSESFKQRDHLVQRPWAQSQQLTFGGLCRRTSSRRCPGAQAWAAPGLGR